MKRPVLPDEERRDELSASTMVVFAIMAVAANYPATTPFDWIMVAIALLLFVGSLIHFRVKLRRARSSMLRKYLASNRKRFERP